MQNILQVFPIIGILGPFILFILWVATDRRNKGYMLTGCVLVALFVLAYLWRDSITELTVSHIGTIKRAATQATNDANAIAEVRKRVNEIYEELNDKVKNANKNVTNLEKLTHFVTTVVLSQVDDRDAFDNLVALSKDTSFELKELAKKTYESVLMQEDGKLFMPRSDPNFKAGVDPNKIPIDEVIQQYWKTDATHFAYPIATRVNVLGYIWKRENISKAKKMDFMLQVLSNDKSIKCVYNAQYYFNEEAHLDFNALIDLDKYKEWWSTNKDKYN